MGVAAGEPTVEPAGVDSGPTAIDTGARLDEHHAPETNGRMAICRRCGSRTDTPVGRHHVPDPRQLARCEQWLDGEARARRIGAVRESLRT